MKRQTAGLRFSVFGIRGCRLNRRHSAYGTRHSELSPEQPTFGLL
ncbi:hypothetical protein D1AOALGA4SA_10797 [Olavius algarvensis Delta 1 endosymbiont]|nr:hypothetical protein D1AOALGA4SA_10797 [Olavius algarvensis Delta 1 endosymbiont]